MATWTWEGQNGSPVSTIHATSHVISFYGSAFNDPITTAAYQDSTHIEDTDNTEMCTTAHVHNVKYVSASSMSLDGGATEDVANLATGEATLDITFSHASSTISSATFWADNGSVEATAPTDVTFQCFEQGDTSWTNAGGSGSALSLTDQTSATDHHYYIACSASPSAVGVKTAFRLQCELTYS